MRADRLLSMLMLLQTRGRVTAVSLAEELEVSVRTIYRDLTALSMAGVPVYAERGPGGGVELIESYRTTLTGLTPAETRALFMVNIPAALSELGLDQELRSAFLKLAAALPSRLRQDEVRTRQRLYVDPGGAEQPGLAAPHLHTVFQAVWEDHALRLQYRPAPWMRSEPIPEELLPYGLVARAGEWYLIGWKRTYPLVIRLDTIVEIEAGKQGFTRPADFDLAAFWKSWWAENETLRPVYPVRLRVAPELQPHLGRLFGERARNALQQAAPPDSDGWVEISLTFEYLEQARSQLLGLGQAVEVLEPEALKMSLVDYARQIVDFYTG